jgi:cell wall-associated NlpC family hydrolase
MKWLTFLLTASTSVGASPLALPAADAIQHIAQHQAVVQISTNQVNLLPAHKKVLTLLEAQTLQRITLLEQQAIHAKELKDNKDKIDHMLAALKKTVGHTWYVFSGDTPAGWDCSGLTLWAYEQIGVTLEHRASIQATYAEPTTNPRPGDIVAFTYNGNKDAYHVGIYLSPDLMIDAPRPGQVTTIESISKMAGNHSKVTYVNVLDN